MTPESPQNQVAAKMRVLVVEDDKFLQRLLVMKLTQDGFDVAGASDGEEGLRRIVTEPPELVVLDLILPKMDGFELLAQMRTNPQSRDIPVIVLSNLGQDEDINRVKQLGAMEFLTKSNISIHEIVQKIKEVMARHLSQKGAEEQKSAAPEPVEQLPPKSAAEDEQGSSDQPLSQKT